MTRVPMPTLGRLDGNGKSSPFAIPPPIHYLFGSAVENRTAYSAHGKPLGIPYAAKVVEVVV
jgi:hypothetical protein